MYHVLGEQYFDPDKKQGCDILHPINLGNT